MNRVWPVPLVLLVAAACSDKAPGNPAAADAANAAAARAAIAAANQSWAEASKRGDAQAIGNLITEDATTMGVDGSDIVGRAAMVAATAKNMAARTFDPVESHIITDSVEVHGDYAYEIGHDINIRRPKGAPAAALDTARSRYITFWRKGSDGTWRASRDFTVPTPKPTK
jgi:uncharacterized protein (TIGR02246 family)